jgi:hypothetical protein
MRDFDKTRGKRTILVFTLRLTARAQGGDRGTVIVAVTIDNLVFLAVVLHCGELAYQLETLLVGFRTGVSVIDAAQSRHLVDQFFGKLGTGNIACGICEVTHFYDLITYRIGDFFTSIADIDGPDSTGNCVQEFAPVLIFYA